MREETVLLLVRLMHTAAWVFFAGSIVVLPIAAYACHFDLALILIGFVTFEIIVLALNGWACPLTPIAARYTSDRRDNFDIFLPLWLARYNKQVFGALFLAGLIYTALEWWRTNGT
ncbi:hypothetical protein BEN78_08390 [Xanthomonas citri pv. mangiferaeindicae]|nr:hypothetical protein BEN78_08390 [Xanthomonas citri pv. mangiferaeindicae]